MWVSDWFNLFQVIPGRMTLLITIFLVLINIFNTIQTNSPQVSAAGKMDIKKNVFCFFFLSTRCSMYTTHTFLNTFLCLVESLIYFVYKLEIVCMKLIFYLQIRLWSSSKNIALTLYCHHCHCLLMFI